MSVRFGIAKGIAAISEWSLRNVFRRPAANFPGKIALYADPQLIAHAANRLKSGSICVVGTNGKTTVSNMLANMLEAAGHRVCCNRTGANLDSGVASALLASSGADWGVFECDELWLSKVTPGLQPDYVVMLNLFRDQLDRCGEIDYVQERIAAALNDSPHTVLIYNADDPQCQAVADRVANERIPFGIQQDLGLPQNTVADGQMCQKCSTMLEYSFRQYGQLGSYVCPNCGFARSELKAYIDGVELKGDSLSFALHYDTANESVTREFSAPFGGHYMVYNIGFAALAASLLGCSAEVIQQQVANFKPDNGRLQELMIDGRQVLLNLAKNPTGFNQSIKLVTSFDGPCAVGFFVNDKEADGHDVSWLWDIDFEELAGLENALVFTGGIRGYDVQVRLKYAGVPSVYVESAAQMMASLQMLDENARVFAIANYTSLPNVKADLEQLQKNGTAGISSADLSAKPDVSLPVALDVPPLVMVHMLPDLLNLYGDGGNVKVLEQRLLWRGIPVEVQRATHGQPIDFDQADLVLMGGSPDREQKLASADLFAMRDDLKAYVEDGGPLLAICGSYQILGSTWLVDGEEVPGLGIVDMETREAGGSHDRLIDNIVIQSSLSPEPIVGFENHAGRTYLAAGVEPLGRVISTVGKGNNDTDQADGVQYKNLIATYLHGPVLSKNPELADLLLQRALSRYGKRSGLALPALSVLPDVEETSARNELLRRFVGKR